MTKDRRPLHDYSNRSGFPDTPEAMRGAAKHFQPPRDMRTPLLLRPWVNGHKPLGTYEAPEEDLPGVAPPVADVAGR